jgi:brefeldin A-inhibited guanine nucleotide-exchange protein
VIERPNVFNLVRGTEIFNISPLQGLTYLFAFGVVNNDPEDLAKFLLKS